MTKPSIDHKFLGAILALQMGFISKDQLLFAMNRWTEDRSRTIDECLVQEGMLSETDCRLLDDLARRHVDHHGGDTEKSMASIEVSMELRKEIESLGDVELSATLARTRERLSTAAPSLTVPVDESEHVEHASQTISQGANRYQPIRFHAEGGRGKVSVALDLELNREVALKEIQDFYADDENDRERFEIEAQVTGGLEHPGIVPVYGLGRYANGRPYYAMRLIQGESLRKATREVHEPFSGESPTLVYGSIEFRKLLGRFVDVCYAIAYAHSRGVIHRDIKPANIMLGRFGETLVVDWGLAKVRGSAGERKEPEEKTLRPSGSSNVAKTRMGSAVGTPAYMSPEQAEGRLDAIGPTSDVYGLGATLFYMLVGHAPVEGDDVGLALDRVIRGDLPAPKEMRSGVPRTLNAICTKAMSAKPADRYASAVELAEDVERHLADEPVEALREPLVLVARRWLRKHPALTASTAAAVIVSAVGLALFSSIVSSKNSELQAMNDSLDQNVRELREANETASQARAVAEKNEQVAREQSQLALSTLTAVVSDIQVGMKNISGAGETRRKILANSLNRLDEVATQYLDQATYDVSTVNALNEMGDVVIRFGVGESDIETIGVTRGDDAPIELANKFYQRARELVEQLLQEDPNHSDADRLMADTMLRVCQVLYLKDEFDAAESQYFQVIKQYRELLQAEPDSSELRTNLSTALTKLGHVLINKGNLTGAMIHVEEGLAERQELVESEPNDGNARRLLCESHMTLGYIHAKTGKTNEAQENYEFGVGLFEWMLERDPTNSMLKRDLAISYGKLGDTQLSSGQTASAIDSLAESTRILRALRDAEPADALAQVDLARGLRRLANARLNQGQVSESIRLSNEAIEISREAIERNADDRDAKRALSTAYRLLGDSQMRAGERTLAIASFEAGLAIEDEMNSAESTNPLAQFFVAETLDLLGNAYLEAGRINDAKQALKRAIEIREELMVVDAQDLSSKRSHAGTLLRLGDVFLGSRDASAASDYIRRGLEILEELAETDENDKRLQADISVALERLGTIAMQANRIAKALEYFERKRELDEELVALDGKNAGFQSNYAISLNRLASIYIATNRRADAIECYRASLEVMLRLVESAPTALKYKQDLTSCYGQLGDALIGNGDLDEGLDAYREAANILTGLVTKRPNDVASHANLSVCRERMGDVYRQLDDQAAAIRAYEEAEASWNAVIDAGAAGPLRHERALAIKYRLAIACKAAGKFDEAKANFEIALEELTQLQSQRSLKSSEQNLFGVISATIEELELRIAANGDWVDIDALEEEKRKLAIYYRVSEASKNGDFNAAVEAADRLKELDLTSDDDLYNLACCYGLVVNAIAKLPEPTEVHTRQKQMLEQQALECLKRAVAAGYQDFAHMKSDPDLAGIRESSEFDSIIK